MNREKFAVSTGYIAWGYVLLYFNINIGSLDLLPSWLAYVLFFAALPVLAEISPSAKLLRPFALGLSVWSGVCWLFGTEWYPPLLGVLESVVALYFHFQLLTELASLAQHCACPQERRILTLRTVNTIFQTVFLLGRFLWDAWEGAAVLLLIANLVVLVWICAVLFGLRRSLREESEG